MIEKKDTKRNNKNNSLFCMDKSIESNNSSNNNKNLNFKKVNVNYKKYFCNDKDNNNNNLTGYNRKNLRENTKVNLTNNNSRRYNVEKENFVLNNVKNMNKNRTKTQKGLSNSKSNNIIIFNKINKLREPKTYENKLNFDNCASSKNIND